jgi:hypothetical protein
MLVLRHRLAIAAVIAAAAIAVPVAALASGPGSPPAKPGPSAAATPDAGKPAPPANPAPPGAAAASKAAAAQSQPGDRAPQLQAFAARLGLSTDAAGPVFKEVARLASQDGSVDPSSPAFAAIASQLGVTPARLAAAWDAVSGQLAHS